MTNFFKSDDDARDDSIHAGYFRTEGFHLPKLPRLPRLPFSEGVDDRNGNKLLESLRNLGINIPRDGSGGKERE